MRRNMKPIQSHEEEDSVEAVRGLFEESDNLEELYREPDPKKQPCTDFPGLYHSTITPVGSFFNFDPGTQTDPVSSPLTIDCFLSSSNNCLVEMGSGRRNNFENVDISNLGGNYQNVLIKQCNCRLKSNEMPHFHCTENAINKIIEGAQESGKAMGKENLEKVSALLNEMNLKLVPIMKGKGNRVRKINGGSDGSLKTKTSAGKGLRELKGLVSGVNYERRAGGSPRIDGASSIFK